MTRTYRYLLFCWLAVMLSAALPALANEDESSNPLAALENYEPAFAEGSAYSQQLELHLSVDFDVPSLSATSHQLRVHSTESQDVQVVPCAGGACSDDGRLPVQLKSSDGGSHFLVHYNDQVILDRHVQHDTERYWTLDENYQALEEKFVTSLTGAFDLGQLNLPPSPFVCTVGCGDINSCCNDGGCGDGDGGGCDDDDCDCDEGDCGDDSGDQARTLDPSEFAEVAALAIRETSRPYMLAAAGVWRYAVMLYLMEEQLQEVISEQPVSLEGDFEVEEGFIAAQYALVSDALPLTAEKVQAFFEGLPELVSSDLISLPADYLDLVKEMTAELNAELVVAGSWYACSGLAYDMTVGLKLDLSLFDAEGEPAGTVSLKLDGFADSQPLGLKGISDDFGLEFQLD